MNQSSSGVLLNNETVKDSPTAQKYLEAGRSAEQAGDRLGAIDAYEAAFAADPDNSEVCFRLAYNLDMVGEEDEAVHLYEQCVQVPSPSLNALLNLTIMYEDRGMYVQAERCVRQVLATDPNHSRACLFIKDILASKAMVIDDEAEKRFDKHGTLIDTPVTDFELSVRTRNALRKMEIRTLGDLLRVTEAELRGFKNLGDASIEEIKAMLAQRGLRLGQAVEQQQQAAKQRVYDQLKGQADDDQVLQRSVSELNLSVRARKALALLSIQVIGDLCLRTEAELMGVKNFGMTSLQEIKDKLAEVGLSLRTLDE
ncbi:MAG: DNA-directed RNA polymerase subunit alpha C-terminal domain-containing protein [Phycisphaeraceae bacterium]